MCNSSCALPVRLPTFVLLTSFSSFSPSFSCQTLSILHRLNFENTVYMFRALSSRSASTMKQRSKKWKSAKPPLLSVSKKQNYTSQPTSGQHWDKLWLNLRSISSFLCINTCTVFQYRQTHSSVIFV